MGELSFTPAGSLLQLGVAKSAVLGNFTLPEMSGYKAWSGTLLQPTGNFDMLLITAWNFIQGANGNSTVVTLHDASGYSFYLIGSATVSQNGNSSGILIKNDDNLFVGTISMSYANLGVTNPRYINFGDTSSIYLDAGFPVLAGARLKFTGIKF